ncbi:MAG TPA: hypothetical protein VL155_18435 [Terriglobales bacterium]|nr:hypothetical protein [Terriglobales bacterium]
MLVFDHVHPAKGLRRIFEGGNELGSGIQSSEKKNEQRDGRGYAAGKIHSLLVFAGVAPEPKHDGSERQADAAVQDRLVMSGEEAKRQAKPCQVGEQESL